jgi:ubiquinone/menaquinone biosynthesis C-methylase UbiE
MSDDHQGWFGWRAHLYALLHRNPASNRAVAEWAELSSTMRVLDIGCGTGAAVRAAAPMLLSGAATGVDPSPEFVRIARRRSRAYGNVSFEVGTAEQLPCDDNTFDVAWTIHSAHHWGHVDEGVAGAYRVLRPGGRLLVVERHDPDRHWGISPARARELAEALAAAGFTSAAVEERAIGRSREFVISGTK